MCGILRGGEDNGGRIRCGRIRARTMKWYWVEIKAGKKSGEDGDGEVVGRMETDLEKVGGF